MTGAEKAILVGVLAATALAGCGKDAAPSSEATEPSSGGESLQVESSASEAAPDPVAATSPWGQTRAEKCRPPVQYAMERKARVQFEGGVLAAA